MRKLLAVAAREMRERWLLFPASFALGFNPLVLPAFGVDRRVMPEVGLMTSVLLGAGAAVVMGSTMLARDVANGRLGFLFSRPVSWPAIWGGKWLAALVLVVSSAFLAAIPWMAAFPRRRSVAITATPGSGRCSMDRGGCFGLTLIVLVVGLANFNATALRSRSPWLALDLVLLLAALWAIRQYVAPLWLYGILGKDDWTGMLALLPLALGLVAGSLAQVAFGRTDVRRAHRAMSLAFWAVVGLALAVPAGYWLWVRSASPAEVSVNAVTRDPAGRWVYVEGTGPHSGWYPHRFLIDTATGRYLARPLPDWDLERFGRGVLFSADGQFGALPGAFQGGAAIQLFDLRETSAASHIRRAGIESAADLDDRLRPVPLGGVGVRGPRVRGLGLRAAVGAARGDRDDPARLAPGHRPLPGGRRGPRLARPLEPGPRRAAPADPDARRQPRGRRRIERHDVSDRHAPRSDGRWPARMERRRP